MKLCSNETSVKQRQNKVVNGFTKMCGRMVLKSIAVTTPILLFVSCSSMPEAPYSSSTPAAKIYESRCSSDGTNNIREIQSTNAIHIPVKLDHSILQNVIGISEVQVRVGESRGVKTVSAYTFLNLKPVKWKVDFFKNNQLIHSFYVVNQCDFLSDFIPLTPLTLDPNLAVPDAVVVMPVFE